MAFLLTEEVLQLSLSASLEFLRGCLVSRVEQALSVAAVSVMCLELIRSHFNIVSFEQIRVISLYCWDRVHLTRLTMSRKDRRESAAFPIQAVEDSGYRKDTCESSYGAARNDPDVGTDFRGS